MGLKTELEKFEKLKKEHGELDKKVKKASEKDENLLRIDSVPLVAEDEERNGDELCVIEDPGNESEILSLKKQLEEKKILVEREMELRMEIEDLKTIILSAETKEKE